MRAYRLAYDGRPYRGFQRQPDVPTVEGALLRALRDLDLLGPDDDVPHGYAAAGRTDAGVSALAQTIAFETPGWLTPRALSGALPDDVHPWSSAGVPEGFHATHDATRRVYEYALPVPAVGADAADDDATRHDTAGDDVAGALDRAREAAARLSGERDLHNLTPDDRGTVRDLEVAVAPEGDVLVLTVASDGFPRHLVRRLASLVDAVARGDADLAFVDRVLGPAPLDGAAGVAPAPPEGLVLVDVAYPGVEFEADQRAVEAARETFAERARTASAVARTAGRVRDGLG